MIDNIINQLSPYFRAEFTIKLKDIAERKSGKSKDSKKITNIVDKLEDYQKPLNFNDVINLAYANRSVVIKYWYWNNSNPIELLKRIPAKFLINQQFQRVYNLIKDERIFEYIKKSDRVC